MFKNQLICSKNFKTSILLIIYVCIAIVVSPISLALICSTILQPLIVTLQKLTKLPYFICVLLYSIATLCIAYVLIHWIVQTAIQFYPLIQTSFQHATTVFPKNFFSTYVLEQFNALFNKAIQLFFSSIEKFFNYFFQLIIFCITFFFSLMEGRKNRYWFFIYAPISVRKRWQQLYIQALTIFGTFLFVELRLFIITFVLLAIGFTLLQFQSALLFAVIIALFDAIPFLGIGFILLPMSLYFYYNENLLLCFSLGMLYVIVVFARQLAETYLWSAAFHLKSVHTFMISATAILLFGFYGIFLSPFLLLATIKVRQSALFHTNAQKA